MAPRSFAPPASPAERRTGRRFPGSEPVVAESYGGAFTAKLFRYPGKGGWTFARVPDKYTPSTTLAWGRAPVRATVDGRTWTTSVWRGKDGKTLLPIPKHMRGTKGDGDTVRITIEFTAL